MIVSDLIKDLPTDFNEFHNYMNSLGILIYSHNQKIGSNYTGSLLYTQYFLHNIETIDNLISKYKAYLFKEKSNKKNILLKNKTVFRNTFTSVSRLNIIQNHYLHELNYVSYDDTINPIAIKILYEKINELIIKSNKYNSLHLSKKIITLSDRILEIEDQIKFIIRKEYGHLNNNPKIIGSMDFYANSDIIAIKYQDKNKVKGNIENINELIKLKDDLQKVKNEKQKLEFGSKEIAGKVEKLNKKLSLIVKNQGFVFNDFKVNICKLTDNDHLRFSPKKFFRLQIDYQSFLEYLKELGLKISFYNVDCFKGINETNVISKLILKWNFFINSNDEGYVEILVHLNHNEELDEFQKLINFCKSHLEFVNKLKIIRSSMYLRNNPIEQIFNNYSKKLINKIEDYKYNIEIKNEKNIEVKILELNNLIVELEKSAWFEIPNVVHTIRRTSSNSWIDHESMIMNSFYKGTNENFGL